MTGLSRHALLDLVELRVDIDSAIAQVAQMFEVDDGPPVALTRSDVLRALDQHAAGLLPDAGLEGWAEKIHTIDEIEIDEADRDELTQALFELSTPELFGGIIAAALGVRRRLDQGGTEH